MAKLSQTETELLQALLNKGGFAVPAPVVAERKITEATNPGRLKEGGAFVGGSGTVCLNGVRGAYYADEFCDILANAGNIISLIAEGGGRNREGENAVLAFSEVSAAGKNGPVLVTVEKQRERVKAMVNDPAVQAAAVALTKALRAHAAK